MKKSFRWLSSKHLIGAAGILVITQTLVIASLGRRAPGPLLSEVIQLTLGLICIVACLEAFWRSRGIARYVWRLLAFTFVMWAVAQALTVYLDLSGNHSLDSFDDTLFFLSVIPFGMLPFLDPDGEPSSFDNLHFLDFAQVCVFAASIVLCFSPRIWSSAASLHIGHFILSRNIAFDGLLVTMFMLRALLTKSKSVRPLFLRMALFLLLSGLADSYALDPRNPLQAGEWFDLVWCALLVIPILIAGTWKGADDDATTVSRTSQSLAIDRVFPLLYPLISFILLAHVERAYPILSFGTFAIAFLAFSARVWIIQNRHSQIEAMLLIDVEKRTRAESSLRQSEVQYRNLFDSNPIPMWVFDRETLKFLGVNEAAVRHYGFSRQEFLAMTIAEIRPEADIPTLLENVSKRIHGLQNATTWRHRKKNGAIIDVEIVAHDLDFHGIEAELVVAHDITDRKLAEERVQFLAYYDALTGLPNRTLLQDHLAKALAGARRRKEKLALLFLDLDGFKDINDSLGHSVGDLLLQDVAERLKKWGREQDTVARVGGDEFLILLSDVKDIPDAAVASERLMDAMTGGFIIQGHSLHIGCSIGLSIFPEHGTDGETLIKNADAAMYSAKNNGRNNFKFFTADMNAQVVERLALESSLRLALDKKQLFLVYQPQMDIATGRITGLEALLRWQQPEMGLVPPDKFIRIAENSGLILPIGEWVLRTACTQARKWQDEGLPAVTIAVNVSAVQFRQEGFCELIKRALDETGLAPRYLELELTESLLLANADVMLSVVRELKAMGLKLAIDDFGTGYSSLSYLKQFPVSKLKIDRSFVGDLGVNPDDAAITTAIISMAKSLHLKVIAEGVENEAQLSFLRTHQCDEIQGYYFSKPLAPEDAAGMLRGEAAKASSAIHGAAVIKIASEDIETKKRELIN